MIILVDITAPLPGSLGYSYGGLNFRKFGAGCWVYQPGNVNVSSQQFNVNIALGGQGAYCGPVNWINFMHQLFKPEFPDQNPVAFNYWFAPGVQGIVTPKLQVNLNIPDVQINGVSYNAITGKNMPLLANSGT